jgi:hypothetical protein
MIERNVKKVFEEYARGTTMINLFDFVALAAKYLSKEDFETTINLKIQTSIAQGTLEAIPLLGFVDPKQI